MGWLTYRYPVCLGLGDPAGAAGLRHPDQRAGLRAVPGGGLGYGVLSLLPRRAGLAAELAGQAIPQVLFNFFGLAPGGFQTFRPLTSSSGHYRDTDRSGSRLLMINGTVFRGQLRMEWEYGSGHNAATIEAFISACRTVPAGPHRRLPAGSGNRLVRRLP